MDVALFMALLTIGSVASSLLTQAIKKTYENAGKTYSSNVIALINAALVGGCGTIAVFVYKDMPVNPKNIVFLLVMIIATWISCTIGYDKVIQTIGQLKGSDDK